MTDEQVLAWKQHSDAVALARESRDASHAAQVTHAALRIVEMAQQRCVHTEEESAIRFFFEEERDCYKAALVYLAKLLGVTEPGTRHEGEIEGG